VWSILLYAFSALAAGFATSAGWLLFFRCTTFVGVCVEFVAAVAWLAELFPDPKRREAVLGWTQAFSSVGGLMVTGAYFLAVHFAESLPAIHGAHAPWRYTLISGVVPALPLMVIRPFLPESPTWRAKKEAGTLKRPSLAAIFQGDLRKVTLATTLLFACSYGAAFGAIQQVPRIVPGLAEVSVLPRADQQKVVSGVQAWQEFGCLAGRMLLAFLAVRIVSRRRLLRLFQVPGLVLLPIVFLWAAITDLDALKWGIFLVGLLTIAQFSFWGNYLPRLYPTHLRGTGESFAANVGGRMIGTSAAFV
jgi:MFS family permease